MKTDDDIYVNLSQLGAFLAGRSNSPRSIYGCVKNGPQGKCGDDGVEFLWSSEQENSVLCVLCKIKFSKIRFLKKCKFSFLAIV